MGGPVVVPSWSHKPRVPALPTSAYTCANASHHFFGSHDCRYALLETKQKQLKATNKSLETNVTVKAAQIQELAKVNQKLKGTIGQFNSAEQDLTTKARA